MDVRTYRIIYEAVEDVRNALEGLLKPEERETVLGEAEVLQLFKVSKVGTIAGCMVRSGTIQRTAKVRVIRDGTRGVHRRALAASSASRTTCGRSARGSSAASGSRTSTTSRSATGSSRSGWKRSSGLSSRRPASARGVIVGIQAWELHLPDCHSLKEKRGVLKPLTVALQRLNVSVAETGHQDLWQRAEIACAVVGTARPVVDGTLRAADRVVEETDGVRIVDTTTVFR